MKLEVHALRRSLVLRELRLWLRPQPERGHRIGDVHCRILANCEFLSVHDWPLRNVDRVAHALNIARIA